MIVCMVVFSNEGDTTMQRRMRSKCNKGHAFSKANSQWVVNKQGKLSRLCKICSRERDLRKLRDPKRRLRQQFRGAKLRRDNPVKVKQYRDTHFQKRREVIASGKSGGCQKCGERHLACLDFHHRAGTIKLGSVGKAGWCGIKRLKEEIAKCDVLCSNCHRKHHFEEDRNNASFSRHV